MHTSLKEVRKTLGISTGELALRLGLSQSTVVRLEQSESKGTISLHTMRKMAEALGCEMSISFKSVKTKSKRRYYGMSRIRRTTKNRQSKISDSMKESENRHSRSLSQEERVLRCLNLSDFARSLQQ